MSYRGTTKDQGKQHTTQTCQLISSVAFFVSGLGKPKCLFILGEFCVVFQARQPFKDNKMKPTKPL